MKKKTNERRITNRSSPPNLKNYYFFSGQQNKVWACGFSWSTGPVGLWSEKFFVKTDVHVLYNKSLLQIFLHYTNVKGSFGKLSFWDAS